MIFIFFLFWASSSEDALFHYGKGTPNSVPFPLSAVASIGDVPFNSIESLYSDFTLKLLLADF